MDKPLRILILEDNFSDAELVQFELEEAGFILTANVVSEKDAFIHALQEFEPDIILSDYDLPQYNGAMALAEAKKLCPEVPFILVTGAVSEDRAIEILTSGAKDYVMKSRLNRLAPAIRRALAEAEEHKARKKAEEAVIAERQRLYDVLETIPAMVCLLTPEHHISFANRSFREKFGESKDMPCYEHRFGFTEPCDFCETYNVLKTGQPHRWEVNCPDGSIIDAHDFPFADVDGSPMILEMDIDITEHRKTTAELNNYRQHLEELVKERTSQLETLTVQLKQREEALSESEARLTFALETSKTGAWDLDLIDHTAYRTEIHDAIFGYKSPLPQWTYEMFLEHVIPEDRDMVDEKFRQAMSLKSDWSFECRVKRIDGEIRWIWATGRHKTNSSGEMNRMAGIVQDITERKRAEEALRESREQYCSVVENTSAIILRVAPSGVITFANAGALNFFGYSVEELIGKHAVGTVLPPRESSGRDLSKMVEQIATDPDAFHANANENMCKDGRRVWMEWTNSGIYDDDGKLKEFLSVGIDVTERKKAQQSQEQLSTLMDHSPSLAFLKDECGRYVYVNKAYIEQFDLPQDWFGKTDFDFWPKESAELFRANDADILQSGQTRQFLEDSTDLAGNRHCWLCYKFLFTDSESRPYLGGIGIDAVDRIRAEEALQESYEKYRTLFENMSEMFQILEPIFNEEGKVIDFRYIKVNRATEILTGKKREDMEGRTALEVWGTMEDYWFEMLGVALKTSEPLHITDYSKIFDLYYDINAWKADENRVAIVFSNITDRKRAEKALRESEERFRAFVKASSDVVYRMSPDWKEMRVLDGNDFLSHANEPDSTWLEKYIHPDDQPYVTEVINEAIRTKSIFKLEHRVLRADGTLGWTFSRAIPIMDTNGKIIEWFGNASDITRRKETEEKLASYAAKLEAAYKEMESFSYSVSHDLRAPLRAIDGFTRMILKKRGDKLDNFTKEKFEIIRNNALLMGRLIDSLLELSRLDRKTLSLTEIDMDELIKEVWNELKIINPERKLSFTADKMPKCYGDKDLIRQVLANLLSNAVKFTEKSSTALIEAGGHVEGEENIYCIKDSGAGFDMAYRDKLFGVFSRLHQSNEFEGTGIGLASVKRIIQKHGGRVWAKGEVGKGATFCFTIPQRHGY